jgi:hypothetical protein
VLTAGDGGVLRSCRYLQGNVDSLRCVNVSVKLVMRLEPHQDGDFSTNPFFFFFHALDDLDDEELLILQTISPA